jgi:hypothetical protein
MRRSWLKRRTARNKKLNRFMSDRSWFATRCSLLAGAALLLLGSGTASGQIDREIDLDTFDPVAENYEINETRRRDQVARQMDLNLRMQWQAGVGPQAPYPFEPWPRVPGDIYGYPLGRPIQQPLGHESVQTGPNRWEYRPIYPGDRVKNVPAPGPALGPAPAEELPVPNRVNGAAPPTRLQPPAPSDARPGDFVPQDAPRGRVGAARTKRAAVGRRAF